MSSESIAVEVEPPSQILGVTDDVEVVLETGENDNIKIVTTSDGLKKRVRPVQLPTLTQSEASKKRIRAIQLARDVKRRLAQRPEHRNNRNLEPFDFASRVFSSLRRLEQGQIDADIQFSHVELMQAISVQSLPRLSGRPRFHEYLS